MGLRSASQGIRPADVGPNALAQALGYVAWTMDPVQANFPGTQANVHAGGVWLDQGDVVTGIIVPVTTAGTGMASAYVGIYDAGGGLVATSANQSGLFGNGVANAYVPVPLSAPFVAPYSGLFYLASSFTAATTLSTVLNFQWNAALSQQQPQGFPRGVHGPAASAGGLAATLVSSGTFTNYPLLIAY